MHDPSVSIVIPEKELADIKACPIGDKYPHYIFPICSEVATEKGIEESRVFGGFWTALHMTAVSIQETGWGQSVLSKMGNNIAGIHATKGKPQIVAHESGTGDLQGYRYFKNFRDCLCSLHYSIRQSKYYKQCRDIFLKDIATCEQITATQHIRAIFMHDFAKVYSEDPGHGSSVIAIYRSLEPFFLHYKNKE